MIEPVYYDKNTSKYNYLMVAPSGARIEFRQTAVTGTYETVDSSYLHLKVTGASSPNDPAENLIVKVYGTDGSQVSYEWKAGAYRCSQIKDRNGNYITIDHDAQGVLRTITDTLNREITVNYDNDLYPTSVTQIWKTNNGAGSGTTTHTYASFTYATKTVSTDFDGLSVYGPPNDTVVKVLDKITYANGFYTKFDYNKLQFRQAGRLSSLTPSTSYGSTSTFASNAQYRAWGALKHLEYGNGLVADTTFDEDTLRPIGYDLGNSSQQIMNKDYEYYPDGQLKFVSDALRGDFDRLNTYDHMGRVTDAKSSSEASGTPITNGAQQLLHLPYRQSYTYNEFGDNIQRNNKQWGVIIIIVTV